MAIYTIDSGPTNIVATQDENGDGNYFNDIPTHLFISGVDHTVGSFYDGCVLALGRLSDGVFGGIPDGNSLTSDTLVLTFQADPPGETDHHMGVIWDEATQVNYVPGVNPPNDGSAGWYNLYDNFGQTTARYGLPNASRLVAYETIQGSSDSDFIKLDYNSAYGGVGYTWDITIYGGGGRDLIVGGEGNDYIDGGDDSSNLGDGVWGQAGNDTIFGGINTGVNNDDIFGGSGNDIVYGSAGDNDEMWGDSGNDTLFGFGPGNTNDSLFGQFGNDTIYGGDGADTVSGSAGADRMWGGNSADPFSEVVNTLDNSTGDWISYRNDPNAVNINLGGGSGVYSYVNGTVTTNFSHIIVGFENVIGSSANDTLVGSNVVNVNSASIDNSMMGGLGGDTISGLAGNDALFGDDDQAAAVAGGANSLFGGDGNDTLYGGLGADSLAGGNGNDILVGGRNAGVAGDASDGADNFNGGAGNDTIYGNGGNDVITNDSGNDTIFGGNDNDSISGGGDAETLYGGTGDDTLFASASNAGQDSIFGEDGNDTINYSPDVFVIAPSASITAWDGESAANFSIAFNGQGENFSDARYDGGLNTDTLVMSASGDLMVADNGDIFFGGVGQAGGNNRISAFEVILAGAGADIIVLNDANAGAPLSGVAYTTALTVAGQDGADTIVSGTGADLIVGGNLTVGVATSDADVLYGGLGGDVLWGDDQGDTTGTTGGNDTLYGGGGQDTYYGSGGNDTLIDGLLGLATDVMYGGAGNDVLTDFANANAFGGDGADQLSLTHTDSVGNYLFSGGANAVGDGNDRVIVTGSYNLSSGGLGLGNDIYISNALGTGNLSDSVDGQDGNDAIATYAGADTISGGIGEDVLWGGAGADVLFGGAGTDFLYAQGDNDTIYGGTGFDFVYFGRNDGADAYWDEDRINNNTAQPRENWIVVYGAFNQSEGGATPDFLLNGAGVRETDHDLSDAINNGTGDMAQVQNIGGNVWQLNVRDTGGGNGQSTLTFDSRDVAGIGLWDNDALDGHVVQVYLWNGSNYIYSYSI